MSFSLKHEDLFVLQVFCVVCCDLRYKLTHLGGKEGRVCVTCHSALMNRECRGGFPFTMMLFFLSGTLRKDQKKVWFADNLLPQCESRSANSSPLHRSVLRFQRLVLVFVSADYTLEEKRTESSLLEELERGLAAPLVFVLNANLLAVVKIVRHACCGTARGEIPDGYFQSFHSDLLGSAGKLLNHLSHSLVSRGFLGNTEHAGFLYVRPTFQSLEGLPLPAPPFLFGVLMLRAEAPWAKAFPLRLMLRLGAEYRFYPCPLFSVRFREPLFGPVNNSIMRLLVDFRFYRYTLPTVPGLVVDLEARSTCIRIPKTRHPELLKALNKSNERVLALGACFNEQADSHLICVQTADGQYQTQAISIHSQPRRVTGSCFFVFSGALKPSSGYLAKSSIVEDGLMVQVTMEALADLRRSLRDMKDFTVTCGKLPPAERQEYVHIQWQDEEPRFNKGIISPIDGKSMESLTNIKTHQRLEYRANGKLIRWTEVFYLLKDQHPNGLNNHTSQNRLTERLARAFCLALCQSLCLLKEDGMTKLALRVTLDGQKSNSQYQGLAACQLELIFYILEDTS
uniref:Zinc finger, FYVE domain containing 9b n=1 Tax=Cyprinus carpio TaxID=7962 RepID=A0A8C1WP82_CYPCA